MDYLYSQLPVDTKTHRVKMGNDASGGTKELEKKENEVADPLYSSDVH